MGIYIAHKQIDCSMCFTSSPSASNSNLYNENKYVFKFFLNDTTEVDDRSSYGNIFHVFGPQKSKLPSPLFEYTLGIFKYKVSTDFSKSVEFAKPGTKRVKQLLMNKISCFS